MLKPGDRITPDTETLAAYNLVLSGRIAEGLADLKALIAKDVDNPMLQFSIAYAYELTGDYKAALQYYSKALPGHVDVGQILSNMSGCLIRLKKFKKALEFSIKAVELEPNNLQFRFNLAMAYESLKQWRLAYDHYKAYLAANSDNIRAYRAAIRCCSKTSTTENAKAVSSSLEELCLSALRLRPGQSWIRRKLVVVYIMRSDFRQAIQTSLHRWPA